MDVLLYHQRQTILVPVEGGKQVLKTLSPMSLHYRQRRRALPPRHMLIGMMDANEDEGVMMIKRFLKTVQISFQCGSKMHNAFQMPPE